MWSGATDRSGRARESRFAWAVFGCLFPLCLAAVFDGVSCWAQGWALLDLDNPMISAGQLDVVHEWAQGQLAESAQTEDSPRRRRLLRRLAHFTEPGTVEAVDLARSADPAVRLLRDVLKWPAPKGVILIRRYADLDAMPDFVRVGFRRPDTQAVTLGCRMIAVRQRPGRTANSVPSGLDRRIVSHELTHAYVNSLLGPRRHQLPPWFHEALACYASKTSQPDPAVDWEDGPGGGHLTEEHSPADYQTYGLLLRYLRARWGTEGLHQTLTECIRQASADPLLRRAGVRSLFYLEVDARYWLRRRRTLLVWTALAVVAVALTAGWRMLPRRPLDPTPVPEDDAPGR